MFYICLLYTSVPTIPMFALFLIAYLVLGGKVLITAGKNIMKGQVFDENFLMCIATIGAFCIQAVSYTHLIDYL